MTCYDFPCEYCDGVVRVRILDREPISHHRGIVILKNVPIGVCDRCGAHYTAAPVIRRVEEILKSGAQPTRTMEIPVETF